MSQPLFPRMPLHPQLRQFLHPRCAVTGAMTSRLRLWRPVTRMETPWLTNLTGVMVRGLPLVQALRVTDGVRRVIIVLRQGPRTRVVQCQVGQVVIPFILSNHPLIPLI